MYGIAKQGRHRTLSVPPPMPVIADTMPMAPAIVCFFAPAGNESAMVHVGLLNAIWTATTRATLAKTVIKTGPRTRPASALHNSTPINTAGPRLHTSAWSTEPRL
jgi:hypothetical protein